MQKYFPSQRKEIPVNYKFGRLTILDFSKKIGTAIYVECKCDCGNIKVINLGSIRRKLSTSCGCYHKESISGKNNHSYKTGVSHTRFGSIYSTMRDRCSNKNSPSYRYYGNRGIKCLWSNLGDFKEDMYQSYLSSVKKYGEKNTTIDRVDNNGNYCKENCRWLSVFEQSRNRSSNRVVTYNNKTMILKDWAVELDMNYKTLFSRINQYGWSVEDAFKKPIRL